MNFKSAIANRQSAIRAFFVTLIAGALLILPAQAQTTPGFSVQPVARGGTGATSLTAGRILIGNGTSAVAVSGDGTIAGNLTASGTGTHTFGTTNTVSMAAGVLGVSTGTVNIGTQGPSGATAITLQSQGSYGMVLKSTSTDRQFDFEGINSGNDYTTRFTNAGAGKHSVSLSGNLTVSGTSLSTFGGQIGIATSTPASAGAAGVAGTIAWDASYIYVCTATNTWKRVAIATW